MVFDEEGENFRLWASALSHNFRPSIVVAAYNPYIPASEDRVYSSPVNAPLSPTFFDCNVLYLLSSLPLVAHTVPH
eukprot:2926544-Rhodomonas_salina.1